MPLKLVLQRHTEVVVLRQRPATRHVDALGGGVCGT